MLALLEAISDDPATRVAVAFLLFNVVPGILLLPIVSPTVVLLQRLWPDTDGEIASRPKYTHERDAVDPATAKELVAPEQGRTVGYLSRERDAMRGGTAAGARKSGGEGTGGASRERAGG